MIKNIYCCGCKIKVDAVLTDGSEVYPHRRDLYNLPFWKCEKCNLFVGCHHKTSERTKPLGCIATQDIKNLRREIHSKLDPLWKSGGHKRSDIYAMLTKIVGFTYHTANLRTVGECQKVLNQLKAVESKQ